MTRLAVLVADRPGAVDRDLLSSLLQRWSERSGVAVAVDVVRPETLPVAWLAAESSADGVLIDVELVRHNPAPGSDLVPAVYVDLDQRGWTGPNLRGRVVYGRGIETYVWAARHLAAQLRWRPLVIRYGDHRDQFGELRVPDGPGPHPVVVLIHGGFWRAHWELDLMDDLSIDLAAAGLAAWNIEYRKGSGSWAGALDDVAAAVDHLAVIAADHRLASDRTALVGHSAGGHLVLWAAGRRRHGPVHDGMVDPALVVPLAPVSDLLDCATRGLGDNAAAAFLGAPPDAEPARYRAADPMQRVPVGVPTTIVQGLADSADLIDQNRRFAAEAAASGEPVRLIELEDTDHFHVIDPSTPAWAVVRRVLADHLGAGGASGGAG